MNSWTMTVVMVLEKKEWIQEIFNKTEQNLINEFLSHCVFEQDQLCSPEPSTSTAHHTEIIMTKSKYHYV